MQLRKLAGMDNPPLLVRDGYSGEERCAICHEQQHLQWSLTGHATAFSSLQRKGATNKQDCIACHVTGYEQPGGYHPSAPIGSYKTCNVSPATAQAFRAAAHIPEKKNLLKKPHSGKPCA